MGLNTADGLSNWAGVHTPESTSGYANDLAKAYNEPSGHRVADKVTGIERELSMGDWLHFQATGELPQGTDPVKVEAKPKPAAGVDVGMQRLLDVARNLPMAADAKSRKGNEVTANGHTPKGAPTKLAVEWATKLSGLKTVAEVEAETKRLEGKRAKYAQWVMPMAAARIQEISAETQAQQAKQPKVDTVGVAGATQGKTGQPIEGVVAPTPTTSSVVQPEGVNAVPEAGPPPVVPTPPVSPTPTETPTNALPGQTTPQASQETGTTAPDTTPEPGVAAGPTVPPAPVVTPEQERTAALLERAKNNEPLERFEVSDLVENVGRQVLLEDLYKTSTKNWIKPREGEAPEQTEARRDTLLNRVVNLIQKRHGMGPYEGSEPAPLDKLVWDFIERDEKGSPVMRDGKYVSLFDSARSESGTYTHQTLSDILDKVEAKVRERGVPLPEIPKQVNKDTKTKVTAGKRVAPAKVDGVARRAAIELGLQSKALKAKLDELAKPEKRQEFERVLVEALNQRYGPTPKANPKADGLGLMGLYQQPRLAAGHVDTFNELDQMLRDDPVFQTTFRQNAGVDFNQVDVPAPGQTRAAKPRFGQSSSVQAEGGLDDNTRTKEDTTPGMAEDRTGSSIDSELGFDDNVEGELDEDGAPVKGGGAATGMRAGPGTYVMWAKTAGYLPDKMTDTDTTVVESQPFARAKQELNALPKNLKQTWISATNGLRLKNLTKQQMDNLRELHQTIQVEALSGAGVLRGVDPGVESDRTGASGKDNAWKIGTKGMKDAPTLEALDEEGQLDFETVYESVLAMPDANREVILKKILPTIVEKFNERIRAQGATEGAAETAGRSGGDVVASRAVGPEAGQTDGAGDAGVTAGTGGSVADLNNSALNRAVSAAAKLAADKNAKKKAKKEAVADARPEKPASTEPKVEAPGVTYGAEGVVFDNTRERLLAERKKQAEKARRIRFGLGEDVAATNPTTEQALRDTIASLLGKGHNWRIHVYANLDAALADNHTPRKIGSAYGWVESDTKGVKHAYFIVDRIEQGTELGKFLHEVGAHIGLENILSEAEYTFLHDKILDWFVAGKAGEVSIEAQAALSAAKRVRQAKRERERAGGTYTRAEEMSELIAYFVEEAVNNYGVDPTAGKLSGPLAEWFRKLISAFKRALHKLNIDYLDALTPQDVVDLAYGAARLSLVERENAAPNRPSEVATPQQGVDIPSHITSIKEAVHNTLSDTYTGSNRGLLGWMGINHMAERFGDTLPILKNIEKSFNKMSHQAKQWLDRGDQIERIWSMLTPKQMELVSFIGGNATLNQFDPSKDQANTPEKQEIAQKWKELQALDAANPKVKGTTTLLAAVQHYRDVHQESLDYLEDVLKQAQAAGASTHAIESVRDTIKALKKKQTHFWLPLHRFGDFHSVAMSPTLFALHQRREQHLDDVHANKANPAAWGKDDDKLFRKLRKDPQHYEVMGHDSERAASRRAAHWQGKGWNATSNKNRYTSDQARAHLKPEIEAFEKMLTHTKIDTRVVGKLIDSYTDLLIESLPENHILKRQLDREGIAGWDPDMKRAFAKTAQSQAFAMSRLLHVRKLSEQLDQLRQEGDSFKPNAKLARDVYEELIKQQDLAMTRSEDPYWVRFATGFNYMSMLGGSPFFWALQLAQVPTITLPYLIGRNNADITGTMRTLGRAWGQAKDFIKWGVEANEWRAELDFSRAVQGITPEELRALKDMDDAGRFVFTIGQDLGAAAEGRNTKTARFIRSINTPTHTTELINRVSTGLAAYRISRKNNNSEKQAIEFALRTIDNTQVNMDPVMGARNLKTLFGAKGTQPFAKIIFQFWKFQQGMAYTTLTTMKDALTHPDPKLKKQARDSAIGLTVSLMATSGLFGLPFVGTGMMLLSFLAGLDGDDDEDDNIERLVKNWIAEAPVPKIVADTLNKGFLSSILPTDYAPHLAPRFSLGTLMNPLGFARFDDAERGEDVVKELMFRVLGGPTGSSAAAFWDGIQAGLDGEYAKATEKIVPLKLMRDLARAYTLADKGVSTGNGETRIDPDDMSVASWVWQAMGVTPMKKGMYHEGQAGVQALKNAVTGEREKLMARHAQARLRGEDVSEITRDIIRFGQKHPYARIDAKDLRQGHDRRRDNRRKLTDTGILADKQNQPYLGNAAWTR